MVQLRDAVRGLLDANRVVAGSIRYTRPAAHTYPHQWLWDSCFHAILWSLLGDREMAHDELRALFRAQPREGLDRGRVPHMTFHATADARDTTLWGNSQASTLTQPPIIAEALLRVGDATLWRELWEPLAAYYDWWLRRRDPRRDGLVLIWHPWECGADATPRADRAMLAVVKGRTPRALASQTVNPTARKRQDLLAARFLLLEDLQDVDSKEASGELSETAAQAQRIALYGHAGADMQSYLVRNLIDLATIGDAIGKAEAASGYRAAATRVAAALERLWDDTAGAYLDRIGTDCERIPVLTPSTLVPLYIETTPEAHARRLLALLEDPAKFGTRWPVPSVARDDATFDPDEYWRGSMWINTSWFTCRGLVLAEQRFGGGEWRAVARRIASASVALVTQLGFREYYRSDGDVAAGFGPEGFGWSGLALDLERMLGEELA